MWFRYYENKWHKYGHKLPHTPRAPRGKFNKEPPKNPNWKAIKGSSNPSPKHRKKGCHKKGSKHFHFKMHHHVKHHYSKG